MTNIVNLVYLCTVNFKIMNIIYAAQKNSKNLLKRVVADYKLPIKSATAYVVDAIGEGLKQNLLGSEINMEFLTLSARVYFTLFIGLALSFPQYLAPGKYLPKSNNPSAISKRGQSATPFKLILQ